MNMNRSFIDSTILKARKTVYNAPVTSVMHIHHETSILSGGTREDLDDLSDAPVWDVE